MQVLALDGLVSICFFHFSHAFREVTRYQQVTVTLRKWYLLEGHSTVAFVSQ